MGRCGRRRDPRAAACPLRWSSCRCGRHVAAGMNVFRRPRPFARRRAGDGEDPLVFADASAAAGADRVVTLDLHAPQIQGFFRIPVDDLYAEPYLCTAIRRLALPNPVVVSPDAGFAKRARRFARRLGAPLAIADKVREDHSETPASVEVIGEVRGHDAVVVDDFTISAGTLVETAEQLMAREASSVVAVVTHGVFAEGSMERLDASPISRLIVTDSIETQPVAFSPKVDVVSVAPLFAEAIRRIHRRESISVLFQD